jgi:ferritin-like metal-binding protein YciE
MTKSKRQSTSCGAFRPAAFLNARIAHATATLRQLQETAMNVDNFRSLYSAELQEACNLEAQLVQALPKMAGAAHDPELRDAVRMHLEETRDHQHRVEAILRGHNVGAGPREHTDQTMQAIIRESQKWAGMVQDPDLRDAGLVASLQRIEHYEIAVYGTLATWAKQLRLQEDMHALLDILAQEKGADERLTKVAKANVNPTAMTA